ncbi:MAG TPA: hypothetical protein CFH78_08380 [Sulfurimonas sp. UBA10385]|nr:MAG TPA: hypothetical protein CFH78_08380 [Sulfurimonas sp. UBA10385]
MSGIQIHEFTDVNYDEIRLLIRGKTSSSTDYNKPDIYAGVDSLTLKNFSYALHGYLGGSVTQGGQDQKQNIAMSVTPNSNEAQSYDISFKDFSKATQATFTGLFTGRTNGYNYSSIGHIGGVQNDSAALGYMKIDLGSTLWSGEITLLGVNYA